MHRNNSNNENYEWKSRQAAQWLKRTLDCLDYSLVPLLDIIRRPRRGLVQKLKSNHENKNLIILSRIYVFAAFAVVNMAAVNSSNNHNA